MGCLSQIESIKPGSSTAGIGFHVVVVVTSWKTGHYFLYFLGEGRSLEVELSVAVKEQVDIRMLVVEVVVEID